MINNNFTHIHLHTRYSLLDGMGSPSTIVEKAKSLNMNAIAITDHNHLGGCLEFQKECIGGGIKPLLGVELYYTDDIDMLNMSADDRRDLAVEKAIKDKPELKKILLDKKTSKKKINELVEDYSYSLKSNHIIFIAKNQIGWKNIVKLQSEAAEKCTYNSRYHCDVPMIEKYKEGLICTTACLGSKFNQLLANNKIDEARELILKFKDMFGEDFYLEMQPLNDEEQSIYNMHLINFSKQLNIKLIATNDVHYINEEDWNDHDTLVCIGTGKAKDEVGRMTYAKEFWIRSYEEMTTAFNNQYNSNTGVTLDLDEFNTIIEEALSNTNEIADKVDANIALGSKEPILPKVDIPYGLSANDYLTLLSYRNLFKYMKKKKIAETELYLNRLAFELNVINTKGYADYMLIVKDLMDWCKKNKIPTGPGRGSASGSLTLFVNEITKCIDPIKYGLLFSRFLTMDRTELPDIDSDFSLLRRQDVIKYLENKYGHNCVSSIGTYTELGVKNGIKDVGKVLGYEFTEMNNVTKEIDKITDEVPSISFKYIDDFQNGTEKEKIKYDQFKTLENKYSEVFRVARVLEGIPRNNGVHASGVLVTPMPINDMFPTRVDDNGRLVTLYTGPQVESVGGVKIDVLGLKTLDVLDLAVKAKNKKDNVYKLYDRVDKILDNEKMFEMLRRKESEGIFQLESDLFKSLIEDMEPHTIEDITVITSIARPGPLSAGLHHNFAKRKRGQEKIVEPLPNTMDIVQDSLGVLVYQEHTMRIAQRVAGFDDNQADSFLRKALAKKKRALMALCDQWFIYGKINEEPPAGYDYENKKQPYYDPENKYGSPILGGINNGYDEKALTDYTIMIADFASYLFNKSHASCYSFLSICCMYLKTFSTKEFLAALLTMQDKQEKIKQYCKVAKKYGIEIKAPDVNLSDLNFTVHDNCILYGLGSIKGIGDTSLPYLMQFKPFRDLNDARERMITVNDKGKVKKLFGKKIGEALIMAGAFDFLDKNRNLLLNQFQDIREAKKEDRFNELGYDKEACMQYEKITLGSSITYEEYWDKVIVGEEVLATVTILDKTEKKDKNGKTYARVKAKIKDSEVQGLIFASMYKNKKLFEINSSVNMYISKEENESFIARRFENSKSKNKRNTNTKKTISNVDEVILNFDKIFEAS